MKILMTGGSGLLGTEIRKLDQNIIAPTHSELDLADTVSIKKAFDKYQPEVVLNLAAYNKPPEHEKDPGLGIKTNIIGTANLALICHERGIKLIHVSTDFVYDGGHGHHKEEESLLPPSRFAWSKLGGEAVVRMIHNYLILRVDFGPVPFPWEKVYKDHFVSKLYVDEIAPLVLIAAKSSVLGIMNIGGPRTTLEAYARRTRPDIEIIPKPDWVPVDTSMDIERMKEEFNIKDEKMLLKR